MCLWEERENQGDFHQENFLSFFLYNLMDYSCVWSQHQMIGYSALIFLFGNLICMLVLIKRILKWVFFWV